MPEKQNITKNAMKEKEKLVKEVKKIIERTEEQNKAIEKILFKTNKG